MENNYTYHSDSCNDTIVLECLTCSSFTDEHTVMDELIQIDRKYDFNKIENLDI